MQEFTLMGIWLFLYFTLGADSGPETSNPTQMGFGVGRGEYETSLRSMDPSEIHVNFSYV